MRLPNAEMEVSMSTYTPQNETSMDAGAVWTAMRPGSRSSNRIVQACGPKYGDERANQGVWYLAGRNISWCSTKAWQEWVERENASFSHCSPDHVRTQLLADAQTLVEKSSTVDKTSPAFPGR